MPTLSSHFDIRFLSLLTDVTKNKKLKEMKFRFCGEGDCPDWVLAEIISTLSNLSASKLEKLTSIVAKKIIGNSFDEDAIKSITADISDDGKSAVACIDFILLNAARYNTDETVLMEELQQLGLPNLHASAICHVLADFEFKIRQKLVETSFKINEVSSVNCALLNDTFDTARLELKIPQQIIDGLPKDTSHTIHIDRANLNTLLKEMLEARNIMRKYNVNNASSVNY